MSESDVSHHTLLRLEPPSAGAAARLLRWWGKVGMRSGSQAAERQRETSAKRSEGKGTADDADHNLSLT